MSNQIADPHKGQMAGGKKAAEDVQSHVKEALQSKKSEVYSQLNSQPGSTFEPLKQRSQVVAGTKYHVKVKTDNDKYLHVGLWRKLDQSYEITDVKEAGEHDEL